MTINTTAFGSYRTTKCLNPDASWKDRIDGDAIPVISISCIESDAMFIIWDALRKAARKEDDDTKAAQLLLICSEISNAFAEAQTEARKKNNEAYAQLESWKAEQNGESEAASC